MSTALKNLSESSAPLMTKPKVLPLEESARSAKRMRVRGPSQRIESKNQNNRVYPKSVWEKNLDENSPFMKRLRERRVLGELEHPESGNTRLHAVSHLIEKAWMEHLPDGNEYGVPEGDYVMGENLILNTPHGQILQELFTVGVPVGISSRGRGNTINSGGAEIVQDDYELNAWDYVENPSVREATHRPLREDEAPPPPGAAKTGDVSLSEPVSKPEPETSPADDSKKQTLISSAEALIRKMEDLVNKGDDSTEDIAEMFCQAVDIIDQLGSSDDADSSKIRGQIVVLTRVLARMLGAADPEAPIPSVTPEEKPEEKPEETPEETPEEKPEEKPETSESLTEEVVKPDIVTTYMKERRPVSGVVFRGELENTLRRYGHEVSEDKINQLASAMRSKGYSVKEKEYGQLPKRIERSDAMSKATVDSVIEALARKNAELQKQLTASKKGVANEKYEALGKICNKLVERAREANKKLETNTNELSEMKKRYQAATKLLEAVVTRVKGQKLQIAIREAIDENPSLANFRSFLEEASDTNQLQQKVRKLTEAVSGQVRETRDDLPPIRGLRRITERKAGAIASTSNDPLMEGLVRRNKKA